MSTEVKKSRLPTRFSEELRIEVPAAYSCEECDERGDCELLKELNPDGPKPEEPKPETAKPS